jgi:hypothetical protein
MHQLTALVVITLHWVSPATREILELLSTFHGMSADVLAQRITKRSRHQIARILSNDGLPCLKKLRMWIRLIAWLFRWEASRTSLYDSAISENMDPAVCYRAVKKLTGLSWSDVRARGLAWLLLRLREQCHSPQKKSGGVSPAALMRQPRGLTRTSARPLC